MWLKLATLALLPVLIVQGTRVRKHTPCLAEPSGEREGEHGYGKPLSILILGDSAAAGVGVETQADALSGSIVGQLQAEYHLNRNFSLRGEASVNEFNSFLGIAPGVT